MRYLRNYTNVNLAEMRKKKAQIIFYGVLLIMLIINCSDLDKFFFLQLMQIS
jgi:hypothetical protein